MSALASVKALVRDTCASALSLVGVTAPAARLGQRLSIITFHRVLKDSQRQAYPLPGLAVTPGELDAHLQFATRHFRCMSLAKALDVWAGDRASGPPLLAITFDDGQLDNYENALPVLERHGVTASFFIPSQILDDPRPLWYDLLATSLGQFDALLASSPARGEGSAGDPANHLIAELYPTQHKDRAIGRIDIASALESTKAWSASQREDWIRRAQALLPRPDRPDWDGFMSAAQMKDLIARGHEIGSHSHSHPLLPQCSDEALLTEIEGSKHKLESVLGVPVTSFCYPNGSTDQRSVSQVRSSGYRAAVTTDWGSNPRGHDPFQLRRFDMNAKNAQDRKGHFSEARLAWRMSGLHPGLG